MKIIASYNIKGGVGKTASAVNLSYLAAKGGARTLVWDLDPQAAASFYFRVKPKVKGGYKALFGHKRQMSKLIKETDYPGLDLIPADFSYRNLDLGLESSARNGGRLRKLLKPLRKEYDFLFLDCPPSISLLSENVFAVADTLLVPTIPTTLSLRTLNQLIKFCDKKALRDLKILPFFSMVDLRKSLHKTIIEHPPKKPGHFLECGIPYASEVEKMGQHRAPLEVWGHSTRAAQAYRDLWGELTTTLRRVDREQNP